MVRFGADSVKNVGWTTDPRKEKKTLPPSFCLIKYSGESNVPWLLDVLRKMYVPNLTPHRASGRLIVENPSKYGEWSLGMVAYTELLNKWDKNNRRPIGLGG